MEPTLQCPSIEGSVPKVNDLPFCIYPCFSHESLIEELMVEMQQLLEDY